MLPVDFFKFACKLSAFALLFQDADEEGHVRSERQDGASVALGSVWRGCGVGVVFDKSFVIMALACAVAPIVGAGIYVMVHLF